MDRYRAFAERHGLTNLIFTGPVDSDLIGGYLARMDLGVIPGCAYHMYPVKYLELGALGVPALTPRYDVFRRFYSSDEAFRDKSFTPGSAEQLARAIVDLKRDPARLEADREHVRTTVLTHHTWERCRERIEHALDATLAAFRDGQRGD